MTCRTGTVAIALLLANGLLWCAPVGAQDAPPAAGRDAAEAPADQGDDEAGGEYDPADEVFAPSETIRADSEISFPSDI